MLSLEVAALTGSKRLIESRLADQFSKHMKGELLRSGDEGFDDARKVWNGMIDKRPALIARCVDTDDVMACVNFARENELLISVRGGGHNYAGKAVCDDGLMIDLSLMKGIEVDPANSTVKAQAGLKLGEFDRETQRFGLATTLGMNTDTGIAGLTLGGGYGWLGGKYGLACDNLISAKVVMADGRVLRASANENEDLFWGLRGAGANFGIVTEFEYQLHPVDGVVGGMVLYPLKADVLRFFDEFSNNAPDEITTLGVVLQTPDGNLAFAIAVCYSGEQDKADDVLKPLRTFQQPLADMIAPRSYVEMQSMLDDVWLPGRHYYNKAHNIRSLSDGAIETILKYSEMLPTNLTNIAFQQLHGAASRIPANETAFPHRYDHFDLLVHPATDNPAESEKMIKWARECWEDLKPFVERAVYVNALEDASEEGENRVRDAYGVNYDRLVVLKRKYDPTNLFRLNSNIKPEGIQT
jgi:FAD/FMN-containing dehydrogenase